MMKNLSLLVYFVFILSAIAEDKNIIFYAKSMIVSGDGVDFIDVSEVVRDEGIKIKLKDDNFVKLVKIHLAEMKIPNTKSVSSRIYSFVFPMDAQIDILSKGDSLYNFKMQLGLSRWWPVERQITDDLLKKIVK